MKLAIRNAKQNATTSEKDTAAMNACFAIFGGMIVGGLSWAIISNLGFAAYAAIVGFLACVVSTFVGAYMFFYTWFLVRAVNKRQDEEKKRNSRRGY